MKISKISKSKFHFFSNQQIFDGFQKKYIFRSLAVVNKLIMPKLYKKDIAKLKNYEKIILGYRYWVKKNSL